VFSPSIQQFYISPRQKPKLLVLISLSLSICLGTNKRRFVNSWLDRQGFYGKYRNAVSRSDAGMTLFKPTRLGAAVFSPSIQQFYTISKTEAKASGSY